jgi:uncharacterized protein
VNTTEFTRREFLSKHLLFGAGTLALGGYASLVEPNRLTVKRLELSLARLPEAFEGIKIAHISDLHFEEFVPASHIQHAIDVVIALRPDLLVVTGDFATRSWDTGGLYNRAAALKAAPCAEILQKALPPLGRYAVLGNHDARTQPDLLTEILTAHGTSVLRNQAVPVQKNGVRIWLAGVDDAVERLADIPRTFRNVPSGETTIALVHEPDVADKIAKYSVDLQLSGHSHGGQVRIPLLGAPILPALGQKYPMGLYTVGNMQLYTNSGLGVVTLPFRFDCPPEITLITLRRGS